MIEDLFLQKLVEIDEESFPPPPFTEVQQMIEDCLSSAVKDGLPFYSHRFLSVEA